MSKYKCLSVKALAISALFLAVISSCIKFPPPDPGPDPATTVPYDFNWKTVQDVSVQVQVNTVNGIGDNLIRLIKIFSSPMLNDGSLIASGGAKPGTPLVVKLTLPTALDTLYVQEILPTGTRTVKTVEITTSQISVNIVNEVVISQSSQVIATSASFSSPSVPIPTNYDVTINNNNSVALTGFASGESSAYGNTYKSYYIPSGFNRTASINMGNSVSHAVLYVKGKLTLSNSMSLNKVSVVILDGGSVTVAGISTGVFTATIPIIYIQGNGSLTSTKVANLSDGIKIVNKGTVGLTNNIDLNNGSTFYNEGTINISYKSFGVLVTNNATLYNSGTINTKNFEITVNADVVNDIGGQINTSTFYLSNGSILNNHNKIVATTSFKTSGGGEVNNFCNISANLTDLQGAVINLEDGSLWESQTSKINNMTVNIKGGSIYLTGSITAIYALNLLSSSATYSLFKCTGNIPDMRYAASQINGKIEFVHTKLVEGSGANGRVLYEALFNNNGSILSKVQTKNILASTCNNAAGQIIITPPAIVDNDADGVAEELDYDDNDPDVAFVSYFPSESAWATFAFEDLWPWKGDYDMNDLVLGFKLTNYSNSANKVTKMDFYYIINASGSSKDLAAAFQLDKINASNIKSVEGNITTGNAPFAVSSNGTETGVTLAVIPLFNKLQSIVPEQSGAFLNTVSGNHTVTQSRSITIKFNTPVESADLNINTSFNFFIIRNELGQVNRGLEIHLPTFLPTSKADLSMLSGRQLHPFDKYKFIDGMMWGIMIPEMFEHPFEGIVVNTAYLHFTQWAVSGGTEYPDWYKNLTGYRDDSKIYSY